MAITTRNAKDWLESTLLNDNTMGGDTPSETDVVSQSSIKAYTGGYQTYPGDNRNDGTYYLYANVIGTSPQHPNPFPLDISPGHEATFGGFYPRVFADTSDPSFSNLILRLDAPNVGVGDNPVNFTNEQLAVSFKVTHINGTGTCKIQCNNCTFSDGTTEINLAVFPNEGHTVIIRQLLLTGSNGLITKSEWVKEYPHNNSAGVTQAYVDSQDAATLSSAQTYADGKILDEDDFASDSTTSAPSQQSCAAYIATEISGFATTGYVDAGDANTLSSAQTYADGKVDNTSSWATPSTTEAPSFANAKTYIGDEDATVLANAASYSDGKILDEDDFASDSASKAPSQQSAKVYIDAGDASTLSSAQSYTDSEIAAMTFGADVTFEETTTGQGASLTLENSTDSDTWTFAMDDTTHDLSIVGYNGAALAPPTLTADIDTGNVGLGADATTTSHIHFPVDLPVYSANANAISGGLVAGDLYRNGTGELFIVYTP